MDGDVVHSHTHVFVSVSQSPRLGDAAWCVYCVAFFVVRRVGVWQHQDSVARCVWIIKLCDTVSRDAVTCESLVCASVYALWGCACWRPTALTVTATSCRSSVVGLLTYWHELQDGDLASGVRDHGEGRNSRKKEDGKSCADLLRVDLLWSSQ